MKREAKLLLDKACDSLLLGIELFNRPSDRGRVSAVLSATQLADKAEITRPRLLAIMAHLGVRDDPDCFKEIAIGKSRYKRYSQKVIPMVSLCLETEDLAVIWENRPKSIPKPKS